MPVWGIFPLFLALQADAAGPAVTQHDVIPVLLRRCATCHGARRAEAGLDLRTPASMRRGGKSGPAVVPGRPDQSLLIRRVRAGEMPPPKRLVEASVEPVEPDELARLERWIEHGAPEREAPAVPPTTLAPQDRAFWAFRPPRDVAAPPTGAAHPIDAFLERPLREAGLEPAPPADRRTLIRRATLDLTGLPPDPDEVEAFAADERPDAFERLIDRLLASARYGERWGRHWLDVAGYADSEGNREQDLIRPHAYRYRDYVIRAFNADVPYDRFLLEQIAGDELGDFRDGPITPQTQDRLVATGFLRMTPDPTWANITGFLEQRILVIADALDVLGSGVMGLSLKCARCHDHKFDPITQADYFRLRAVFKGALDEYDWLKPQIANLPAPLSQDPNGPRLLDAVTPEERGRWERHEARIEREIEALGAEGAADRDARIAALEATRLPEPKVRALWDRGEPSPTYIFRRGDPSRAGPLVEPGVPAVLGEEGFQVRPPAGGRSTGRRLAFARWLTRPDHPLTARVMVNRIWRHHFGRGIVETLGDFGRAGARPTHPELLDWLALEFVRRGWSVKAMHRLMITSAAYRRASRVDDARARLDPDGRLLSHMPLRRMEAEVLHDSLLWVGGRLDETPFGPPDGVIARPDGLVTPQGRRRAIYVRQQRKAVPSILESFDLPPMNPNCAERRESTVATQALYLLNDGWVREQARAFAGRLRGDDPVGRAFHIALGRPPAPEERVAAAQVMADLDEAQALEVLCHALLNAAAFQYID
jgi:mono/diheme cytochrome c family protein